MSSVKSAYRREHTGTRQGDGLQRQAQEVAYRFGGELARLARASGVGIVRLEMKDEDRTLTPSEEACMQIVFTGTMSADRRVFVSDATDATAFMRWVTNLTAGGFDLLITNTDGSATVATTATEAVIVSASGPALLT